MIRGARPPGQRVLGQHGGEVAAILGRSVDVGGRIAVAPPRPPPARAGVAGSRGAVASSASAARRRTGRSATPNPTTRTCAFPSRRGRGDAGQREVAGTARDLREAPARGAAGTRDLDEQLVLRERGDQEAAEELAGRHPALARAARAGRAWRRARERGGQLRGRIGVGEAAAESAAIADGGVADVARRLGQERRPLAHQRRARDRRGGPATPGRAAPSGADRSARARRRRSGRRAPPDGEAHVEQRHEALATREQLRVAPARREKGDRLRGVAGRA